MKSTSKKIGKSNSERQKFYEEIVNEVTADFEKRRLDRVAYERQWELNMNYLSGNQYCDINSNFEIVDGNKNYYWQEREVFNHIAPLIEARLAKFDRVSPIISVKPKTENDKDVDNAFVAEKLIESAFNRAGIDNVVKKVTCWSEVCGTGFYKVVWDNFGGNKLGEYNGEEVYEGEVKVLPVSPFEIYPDNYATENIEDLQSIIHAKAISVEEIKQKYGVAVIGEDINVFNVATRNLNTNSKVNESNTMKNSAIVIEKYEKPTEQFPKGRLITVACGKLLYYGELPYYRGNNGYIYPFVKQESQHLSGSFYGTSIIERLIPVQRAYNAVKNRKHEFINRLSMGVMSVEDGSIDVDDLTEEGLSPGKVIVYRQGSTPPKVMENMNMPNDFSDEEEQLLNEFVTISGVSDISSKNERISASSGTALEILIEQGNERLLPVAERIRQAYLEMAKRILSMYSEFLSGVRAVSYNDSFDNIKVCYADKEKIEMLDITLENENELLFTPLQKKELLLSLYNSGLLSDENGKIRQSTKEKVLELLGYKDLDYQKGLPKLQEEKAQYENSILKEQLLQIEEIDDDSIHIEEHTRYILSEYKSFTEKERQNFYKHIALHNERVQLKQKENI